MYKLDKVIFCKVKGTNTDSLLDFWNGPELKKALLKVDQSNGKVLDGLSNQKNANELRAQVTSMVFIYTNIMI